MWFTNLNLFERTYCANPKKVNTCATRFKS
jgi:hypothetical protein